MAERSGISVEVVSRVRRSIVAVAGQTTRGSGFFALPNGLVVTSQEVVGYEPSALLILDDGRSVEGRVVHVDVAKDLAFVMPREPTNGVPLRNAPSAPRLGESVMVLGHGVHGALLTPGIVSAVETMLDGLSHIQIDAVPAPELRGAPLVDVEGRVLGVVTRQVGSLILPMSALESPLADLGGPPASLVGREPVYECPACRTPFTAELDRCSFCGVLLPHGVALEQALAGTDPGEAPVLSFDPASPPPIAAARTVKEVLAAVGIVEGRARRGPRQWVVSHEPGPSEPPTAAPVVLTIAIDATGCYLLLRVPVARIAPPAPEAFLRLLMTLNDETTGLYRLSLAGDGVYLTVSDPVESYLDRDVATLFSELVRLSEHYRNVLSEALGVAPAAAR